MPLNLKRLQNLQADVLRGGMCALWLSGAFMTALFCFRGEIGSAAVCGVAGVVALISYCHLLKTACN
jgi:hypothetical protein